MSLTQTSQYGDYVLVDIIWTATKFFSISIHTEAFTKKAHRACPLCGVAT